MIYKGDKTMIYKRAIAKQKNVSCSELVGLLSILDNKQITVCGVDGIVIFNNADKVAIEIYENIFDTDYFEDVSREEIIDYIDSIQKAYVYRDLDTNKLIDILKLFEDKEVEICGDSGLILLEADNELSLDFYASCHSDKALNEVKELYAFENIH